MNAEIRRASRAGECIADEKFIFGRIIHQSSDPSMAGWVSGREPRKLEVVRKAGRICCSGGESRCGDIVERGWRYSRNEGRRPVVDALAEKPDARLREWKPEIAAEARERIAEVMELADHSVLDFARSRAAEQEVLDLLDEPPSR